MSDQPDDFIIIDDVANTGTVPRPEMQALLDEWVRKQTVAGKVVIGGVRVYDDGRIVPHSELSED